MYSGFQKAFWKLDSGIVRITEAGSKDLFLFPWTGVQFCQGHLHASYSKRRVKLRVLQVRYIKYSILTITY